MADRRREQRLHAELRVKVSGVDACCSSFSEYAIATNISEMAPCCRTSILNCAVAICWSSSTDTTALASGSSGF